MAAPRATAESWEWKPIQKPASAPWHVTLSPPDLDKIMHGFVPQQMEDKWFCFADGPDADGNVLFRLCRSWTGAEIYTLHLRGTEVTRITWEDREGEAEAKQMATQLCRGLMGCKFAVS